MNTRILTGLLALMVGGAAHATLYTYNFTSGFNDNGVIPDANVAGWQDTRDLDLSVDFGPLTGGTTTEIVNVQVHLNLSGGYNGDLYGYLRHSSGYTILLNHIGADEFGNSGAGMNVTLSGSSGNDIHTAADGFLTGTYHPDDSATSLDSFNGLSADGGWTLFLQDTVGGDISTLVGWGLDIEVVPEPTTWALIAFAALAVIWKFVLPWLRKLRAGSESCV